VSTSDHNKEILKKSQEESETEVDIESNINKLQSQFKNTNKITLGNDNDSGRIIVLRDNYKEKYVTHTSIIHNWYPKPPDLQLEEKELGIRAKLGIRVAYIADALYEWNINGLSEYEILNILYEIMMTTNTYKSDHQISKIVSNQSIKDVLIFIEELSVSRENIYDSLEHSKYLTSTDFKWYKDVFLSKLLIRMDNRAPYWKQKFIDYFAHKVKEKFNICHNNYTSLTYEKIINTLKHEKC
jgi:hypothetical protein